MREPVLGGALRERAHGSRIVNLPRILRMRMHRLRR